jgi:hypothetical protein
MIWFLQNWRLALLMAVAFAFGAMRIRARWLSDRLDKAQAREASMKKEIEAYELRNEVENRIAADRADPRERLRREWSE